MNLKGSVYLCLSILSISLSSLVFFVPEAQCEDDDFKIGEPSEEYRKSDELNLSVSFTIPTSEEELYVTNAGEVVTDYIGGFLGMKVQARFRNKEAFLRARGTKVLIDKHAILIGQAKVPLLLHQIPDQKLSICGNVFARAVLPGNQDFMVEFLDIQADIKLEKKDLNGNCNAFAITALDSCCDHDQDPSTEQCDCTMRFRKDGKIRDVAGVCFTRADWWMPLHLCTCGSGH